MGYSPVAWFRAGPEHRLVHVERFEQVIPGEVGKRLASGALYGQGQTGLGPVSKSVTATR